LQKGYKIIEKKIERKDELQRIQNEEEYCFSSFSSVKKYYISSLVTFFREYKMCQFIFN
jgi:hypothetical protein